jgi:hypothetical protein
VTFFKANKSDGSGLGLWQKVYSGGQRRADAAQSLVIHPGGAALMTPSGSVMEK